ncbi:hypothetical protein EIP86_009160 [Pleurotus ostreatoroseus]|nr:hypothetical protein EIP86_009160 [Pleurotus ostreatoroseus]
MGLDNFDAPNVYYTELSRHSSQWLGHPLWYPDPEANGEVEIGDVGIVQEGRFLRLFNAVKGEGSDADTIPDGFKPLTFPSRLRDERKSLVEPGSLASASIKFIDVEGSAHQGAILQLKDHARGACVVQNKFFPNYMKEHHRNWATFAEQQLGLTHQPEDLVLVRGWVKTSEWAVAAFKSKGRASGATISASFTPALSAGFEFKVSERQSMMAASNRGPKGVRSSPTTPNSSDANLSTAPQDQCIFLRYYKIRYRRFLSTKIVAAAGPSQLPDAPPEDQGPGVTASDTIQFDTEAREPPERAVVPLDILLEYILEYSNAEVAIATEGDLEELFSGEDIPNDIANYLRIHRPNIAVDEENVGMLSIESLILAKQRRRRAQAHQGVDDDDGDSLKRHGAANAQGNAEKVVLAGGKTLQWLDIVLKDHEGDGKVVNSFSISRNGERIVTGSDREVIKLWDLRTGEDLQDFVGHEDAVLSVAFSPDGAHFVSGSADDTAIIWDVDGAQIIATLEGHTAWVWCVAYSPDNSMIATGSFDQTVRLWTPDGALLRTLPGHEGQVMHVAFSPDSTSLFVVADTTAYLWDPAAGTQRATFRGHTATIWGVAFARAGDRVATGSDDGTARVWDAQTGDELVTLREHTGPVWAVDFNPDGRLLATGSFDATIATCDSLDGQSRYVVRERLAKVHTLAYSRDGKYIASGDADGLVKLWDADDGAFVAEFQGHQDGVKTVAWTPDDKSVVSSSEDGCVRVWSVQDVLRVL